MQLGSLQGRLCGQRGSRRSSKTNSSSSFAGAAAATATQHKVLRPLLAHSSNTTRRLPSLQPPAAQAAASQQQPLDGIVPYINKHAPRLKGRSLAQNPVQGLWEAAAHAALRAELLLAAAVDRHTRVAPYLMSTLAAVLLGTGLDAVSLLQHGLPAYMPDLLLTTLGVWDTGVPSAVLTAAAVPVTAWAVRAWWRTNMQLLGSAAAAIQHHWQQQRGLPQQTQEQQQEEQGGLAGGGSSVVATDGSSSSTSQWVAAAVTLLRGVCLTSAAASFTGLLYTRGASSMATALTAATGVAGLAVAAASLVLLQQQPQQQRQPASSSSSSHKSAGLPLLAPLLAAEAAWVVAALGLGPLCSAAAAVVLAGGLYLMHTAAVAPALLAFRAAEGDVVEVHVGLKLAGTRPVFDSTVGEEPLRLSVGPVPPQVAQTWEAASSTIGNDNRNQESSLTQQQQQQTGSGETPTTAAAAAGQEGSSSSSSSKGLSDVQRDIQGWMGRPMARWETLKPFVAQAAQGMYLGQTLTLPLFNPKVVGYWNPSFTWWQPIAEVQQKFEGQVPGIGDVFWYPVADGAAVPTRVNAIGQDYVELDANYGVTDTGLELEVQLVRLQKS